MPACLVVFSEGGHFMLGTLPAPILLDIAILFTALSWGLGFFIADRKVYLFESLARVFCLPVWVQRSKRGRASVGRGRSAGALGYSASLVCP
jgi:hypothetical protein